MKRTYLCLPGAWMGAWSWQFVLERLRAIQVVDSFFVPRPLQETALDLIERMQRTIALICNLGFLDVVKGGLQSEIGECRAARKSRTWP